MLLFRSEEEVDAWCETKAEPRGETLSLESVWALSQAWYGNRISPSYRGRTIEEARRVFAGVGLTSPFWQS
jgi:hypothetical protein